MSDIKIFDYYQTRDLVHIYHIIHQRVCHASEEFIEVLGRQESLSF